MKLGELIAILKTCKQDAAISVQAPIRLVPKGVDSYRGYYDQLAINVEHVESWEDNTTVGDFLKKLEAADGATFTGYKGGEFRMGPLTNVWVSNYGDASSCLVTGVVPNDYDVKIQWSEMSL